MDGVFQLPHIPGPVVAFHQGVGVFGKAQARIVALFGEAVHEEPGHQRDVLGALAEGREVDPHDVEAIEQIFAEAADFDFLLEVPVGGGDDSNVGFQGLIATDAGELAFLQHAQDFGLHMHRHFADLIQEQGAAVALFKAAHPHGGGSGEAAFFMAEEFTFQQAFRDGGAVDRDKGFAGAQAVALDGAGDDFLAAAALARDHHRSIRAGYAADNFEDALHGLRTADHHAIPEVKVGLGRGGLGKPHGLAGFQRAFHQGAQIKGQGFLAEKIKGPQLHGLDHRIGRGKGRAQHHHGVGVGLADALQDFDAIHRFEVKFRDDQIRTLGGV